MKKFFVVLLTAMLLFSFIACDNNTPTSVPKEDEAQYASDAIKEKFVTMSLTSSTYAALSKPDVTKSETSTTVKYVFNNVETEDYGILNGILEESVNLSTRTRTYHSDISLGEDSMVNDLSFKADENGNLESVPEYFEPIINGVKYKIPMDNSLLDIFK